MKQRPLRGSFFVGLARSRSIGWGAGGAAAARGLEEEEAAGAATGAEQNENGLVAAFGWVSRNRLHWLSSKEVLRFHSAQVVGMGSSR